MRPSLEPEPEPEDQWAPDADGHDPFAEWLEDDRAMDMVRRLTRLKRGTYGRRIAELRCPIGNGRIAGLYVVDGQVWLWREGTRHQWPGGQVGAVSTGDDDDPHPRHQASPPRAEWIRDDRVLPHPRGCGCDFTLSHTVTCRCCKANRRVIIGCDDRLSVVLNRRLVL